jgi:hypothetical protein
MLSTHLCLPFECHLEAVFHVFAYLGLHHNSIVLFDPTYSSVDMGNFIKTDWNSMYGDVKEMIPSGAPASCGKEVDMRLSVDYDHVKLLPLPQPPLRDRTEARTNPSAQRATQLRSVLARVCAVARQNQITTTVP